MTGASGPEVLLPRAFARREGLLAHQTGDSGGLTVTAQDTVSVPALQEARRVLGAPFTLVLTTPDAFLTLFEEVYGTLSAELDGLGDLEINGMSLAGRLALGSGANDLLADTRAAPVVTLINTLLRQALRLRASDVHFEPQETGLRVRMRVDGVLRPVPGPALERSEIPTAMVISRLKVMADLDIAELRRPQDGRISLRLGTRSVDVRVSTMPSRHGERVVLRLLDKEIGLLSLAAVGLAPKQRQSVERMVAAQNGLVLVTGPTGSGKTTTLYAVIDHLNRQGSNILTVEDPVEYDLPGVGQTQVNSKIDMSFAKALRAILRQDPDIVLVGEIRDAETASVAVQAALTGHLVLSTLHTNTALGAVTRLRDLGVEPFLLASTLRGCLAQRLVRVLCPECKQAAPAVPEAAALFTRHALSPPDRLWQPAGCRICDDVGFAGRIGLYEIAEASAALSAGIAADDDEARLVEIALRPADTLFAAALRAVAAGQTSLDEALRVVGAAR